MAMDERKICFITCVSDEEMYAESSLYIRHLCVPEGMCAELLPVRGAPSMAAGYEWARQRTDAQYKIYLHQDVLVLKKDILPALLRVFAQDRRIGIIGLAGCRVLPADFIWWHAVEGKYIKVAQSYEPGHVEVPDGNVLQTDVQAADGLFLATQQDLPWREPLVPGWHFYDIAQCLEYRRHGYRVVLPAQEEPWVLHLSKDKLLGKDYELCRRACAQEYGEWNAQETIKNESRG